jgi:ribosomal protein S27AE
MSIVVSVTSLKDYNNGKIYGLFHKDRVTYPKCYIGSTIRTRAKRWSNHKAEYKMFKNGGNVDKKTSFDLFDEYGIDNIVMEVLEDFPSTSKDLLLEREKAVIALYPNAVNKFSPIGQGVKAKANYNVYMNAKIPCPNCGDPVTRTYLTNHQKRPKCIEKTRLKKIQSDREQSK